MSTRLKVCLGKDAIVVLVPVGHLGPGRDGHLEGSPEKGMDEIVRLARRKVMRILEKRLGMVEGAFERRIVHEEVNTPETCESRDLFFGWVHALCAGQAKFKLDKGAILGLSHSFL